MPEPGIAEVAALTAVQERQATAPRSKVQRTAAEVTRLTSEGHFRKGLELHANTKEVDFGGFDRKLAGFGVNVNNAGLRERTTEETNLITDPTEGINANKAKITEFLDKGYDGVPGQQADLIAMVLQQARRNPAMAAEVTLLTGPQQQAFAERYLRDPAFLAHLKDVLNHTLEGDFDNTVLDAYEEWQTKHQEDEDITEEVAEAQRRLTLTETRLRPFRRIATTGRAAAGATSAAEIDALEGRKGANTADVDHHQREIELIQGQLTQLEGELNAARRRDGGVGTPPMRDPAVIAGEYATAEARMNTAKVATRNNPRDYGMRVDFDEAQADFNKLAAEKAERAAVNTTRAVGTIEGDINTLKSARLIPEQNDLRTKQGELKKLEDLKATEKELEDAEKELRDALREARSRQRVAHGDASKLLRAYESQKALRLAAETTFKERVSGAYGEAAAATMNDVLQESLQHMSAGLNKLKEEEKGEAERIALEAIQNRWQVTDNIARRRGPWWNRRTETHRPVDKAQLGRDFDTLLNNGDRQLVVNILRGGNGRAERINPTTGVAYTENEINSLLDKKDFSDKIGGEAIKQLLAQRFLTSGFRREDINIIARSTWGAGMLDKAIQSNAQFRSDIEKVMGQNAFNRTGFRERFAQVANERPWLIYSLLGIPFAARMALEATPQSEQLQNQN